MLIENMRFIFILLLISNLKNVYGSFKKDCKHGLDLVGFDELDGKYKQVNSIYYEERMERIRESRESTFNFRL